MKRDIEKIKVIQQGSEEEKTIFLTQLLKQKFENQLLAYSFVPNLEEKVWENANKALLSYQETTPVLFPIYLSREIHMTIKKETTTYLKEKKISLEPEILAFFQLTLTPIEDKFLTGNQIATALSIPESKIESIEKEIKLYQKNSPEEVEMLFPQYKGRLEKRNAYYKNVISSYKNKALKNTITEEELLYLSHFLGGEEDICLDISEIAKRFRKKEDYVSKVLKSAAFKTENYVDTRETLFERYPACKDLYSIRISSLIEKKTYLTRFEQDLLIQIFQRDEHGFYPTHQEVAKKLGEEAHTIRIQLHTIQKKLEDAACYASTCEKIPHFQVFWDDFLDSRTSKKLSKKQVAILENRYERLEDETYRERTNEEIAKLISTELLPVDALFVSKNLDTISNLFQNYKAVKEQFFKTHPQIPKKITQYQELTLIEFRILTELLQRDEHGFYPTYQQIAKKMGKAENTVNIQFHNLQRKLKDPFCYHSICEKIPNFQVFWEDFLDSRTSKKLSKKQIAILENRYEKLEDGTYKERSKEEIAKLISTELLPVDAIFVSKNLKAIRNLFYVHKEVKEQFYKTHPQVLEKTIQQIPEKITQNQELTPAEFRVLTEFLQKDEHGFYPTTKELSKKLEKQANAINTIIYNVRKKLENTACYDSTCEKIPHFQVFWDDFLDSRIQGNLSNKQIAILKNRYERLEDETYRERTNEEIAKLISTELLPVDAVFVAKNLKTIRNLFYVYKEVKEQFYKTHPQIPEKINQQQKLSSIDISLLTELLQRDEHGFYPTYQKVAQNLGKKMKTASTQFYSLQRKLENPFCYDSVCKEIPNFQILWDDYLDSKTQKELSKRQIAILENRYERLEDGTYRERTNEEIAKLISTELLPVDALFVSKNLEAIKNLFQSYKGLKEQFFKTHPHIPEKINQYQKLNPAELSLLTELLQRDEHGFYPTQQKVAQNLGKAVKTVSTQFCSLQKKLEDSFCYHSVCKEIPNFQILWDDYLDSKTQKELSKRQIAILENRYERLEDGTYRERTNEEIAKLISTELLPVDAIFVSKNLKTIKNLLNRYKDLKEKFDKKLPQKVIPNWNQIQKKSLEETNKIASIFKEKQTSINKQLSILSKRLQQPDFVENEKNMENVRKICDYFAGLDHLLASTITEKESTPEKKEEFPSKEETSDSEKAKSVDCSNATLYLFLKYQLKKQKDGTYPTSKKMAKFLKVDIDVLDVYVETVTQKIAEQEDFLSVCHQIPDFDLLFNDFLTWRKQDKNNLVPREEKVQESRPRQMEDALFLTEEEVQIIRSKSQFDYEKGTYKTQAVRAKELNMAQPTLSYKESYIKQKLQDESLQKIFFRDYPDIAQDYLTYLNFSLIQKKKDASWNSLETSCFHDFLQTCTEEQKEILALRLGYQDGILHKTEEVALKYHVKEEVVQSLTKACLYAGKEALLAQTNKGIQKKK